MSDWSSGYNVDLGYTYGYYREQDPGWMDLSALLRGLLPPSRSQAKPLRYVEFGCGQGVSLCFIAACHPDMQFVGIDFNPQHIAHAQSLARTAGLANVVFIEADFADLAKDWPPELGRFHYASAHGIYTWIGVPTARALVECLRHALLPGGLFYISYNALPGWLAGLPIQHLLRHWQVREELSSTEAIRRGAQRLSELAKLNFGMATTLPTFALRVDKLRELDVAYLTQEYLHETWRPFWFDQIERELAPAKLRYVGTVASQDWFLAQMLPAPAKAILEQYQDPVEREVMLDVLSNQSFRRDLWARGEPPIWPAHQRQVLLDLRFALLRRPPAREDGESPFRYASSLGELQGKPEAYEPIYAALEAGPKTLRELLALPDGGQRPIGDTMQILGLMMSAGHACRAAPPEDAKPAAALNRTVAEASLAGAPYRFQIAPALGHVLQLSDTDILLLALYRRAPKLASVETLSAQLVDRLRELGRGLKDGERLLTDRDGMMPRARSLAEAFLGQLIPQLQRFGMV